MPDFVIHSVNPVSWFIQAAYYNKIPGTEWFINNKHLLLTVLECGKSKINMPTDLVSAQDPLPGVQMDIIFYLQSREREKQALSFLLRALIPS